MKQTMSSGELRGLALDVRAELAQLQRLAAQIEAVQVELAQDPERRELYYENLALKLHNFYTGCERIFRTVASELNGGAPEGFDWHRRLLERMAIQWEGRPALLRPETARELREYLAFRHVVRNIYGFELDPQRIGRLLTSFPGVWSAIESDAGHFVAWMLELAGEMDQDRN